MLSIAELIYMAIYYTDTDHLYSYIIWKYSPTRRELISKNHEDEKIRYENFKNVLFNNSIQIKVPLIVVGELINSINKYHNRLDTTCVNYIYGEIFSIFRREDIDFSAPDNHSYNILKKIIDKDSRFDPTDALIVSQALSDEDASHLLTLDGTITNSFSGGTIHSLNQELRQSELKLYKY